MFNVWLALTGFEEFKDYLAYMSKVYRELTGQTEPEELTQVTVRPIGLDVYDHERGL